MVENVVTYFFTIEMNFLLLQRVKYRKKVQFGTGIESQVQYWLKCERYPFVDMSNYYLIVTRISFVTETTNVSQISQFVPFDVSTLNILPKTEQTILTAKPKKSLPVHTRKACRE